MKAIISDFGGVLTTPLAGAFAAMQARSGHSMEDLGRAIAAVGLAQGANPLFEMETGRLSEADFLAALGAELSRCGGETVDLSGFGAQLFDGLEPNEPFLDYLRGLRGRGHRMAICTNNVREWSQRWQAMIPVAELFDAVVDSSVVGARKPEPRIYELTLAELGVPAADAVFIDDLEPNCAAAAGLGMHAVWFQSTEQAVADTEAALADGG